MIFNPFEDYSCDVFQKDYVAVRRIAGTSTSPAKFRKTYLMSPRGDFRYWNNRENQLLLQFRKLRLKRVVQMATVSWNANDEFDYIETLDAGPSLYDWLRVQPLRRDGGVAAHPFADAGALLKLLRGAILALTEIHDAGIVHGDVREGNICLPIASRSGDGRWISQDWDRLRLIDFAFSLSRQEPLRQPLPIEPTSTMHSPAYFIALERDNMSGKPNDVERLDWRIDLYSLGLLAKRLIEKHTIAWPDGKLGHNIQNQVSRLLDRLLRLDSTPSSPDSTLHGQLLGHIDTALSCLGLVQTEAFSIHVLNDCPLALGGGNSSAVRQFPPPKFAKAIAQKGGEGVSRALPQPPTPTPIRSPVRPPLLAQGHSHVLRAGNSARLLLPRVSARSWVRELWDRFSDSVSAERFRARANQGDPEACYRMGLIYVRGSTILRDLAAAAQLFQVAADAGHAGAQTSLAWMLELGMGVVRDECLAAEWYARASSQNNPIAQYNLAIMFAEGRGVAPDDQKAIQYLNEAAEAGLSDAYFSLGEMTLAGRGVAKNTENAIECYRRAVEMKHGAAARKIGWLIEKGDASKGPNPADALTWFRKALKLGYSAAESDIQRLSLYS